MVYYKNAGRKSYYFFHKEENILLIGQITYDQDENWELRIDIRTKNGN